MTGTLNLMFGADGSAILSFHTRDQSEARETFDKLNGVEVDAEFKKHRKKRSLDANAYAWVLIDKIAFATGIPKTEIYKGAIREIGGNSETVCVLADGAEMLKSSWESHGRGWMADITESKLDRCVNVVLYYGSSVYDTVQMTRLIDNLIQDAKSLNIETLPPYKLEEMMRCWNEANIERKK